MTYEDLQKNFGRVQMLEWFNLSLRTDCRYPYLDSGATPIGSAGRAPDRTFLHSRIMPGDLILCRVTLFCHRQLTNKSWARYLSSLA